MKHITHNKKLEENKKREICSMFHVPCSMKQHGFVASLTTLLVLIFMLSVAMSMSVLIFSRQKISTNVVNSTKTYYTAEAGVEDSLIRLRNNPQMAPLSYTLTINNSTSNVVIPAIIGGARSISSQGNNNGLIKTIQVIYAIDSQGVSFHYGAQVGAGGLQMSNQSKIKGNVFSDGNITGSGLIDNNVIVAGSGNSVKDVHVKGNVLAYSCLNPATVDGNLTYVTGGTHTCTVGGTTSSQSNQISTEDLPISQEQIDSWKSEATDGSVISGNYTVSGTQNLGPVKITGNLTINNNATLNMTGTIYVVGTVGIGNNATVKLDNSFGALGGVFLSDGVITVNNNAILTGSGQPGSYLLLLSTSTSNNAIGVGNNSSAVVYYTSAGGLTINNNANVREITAYKLSIGNNAVITYDSGLANLLFSDGPSGGWKITGWQEK